MSNVGDLSERRDLAKRKYPRIRKPNMLLQRGFAWCSGCGKILPARYVCRWQQRAQCSAQGGR
jgi:hypothetical protein